MAKSGISNEEYQNHQEKKALDDFINTTNQRLQNLGFSIDQINKSINDLYAKCGSQRVESHIEFTKMMETCVKNMKDFKKIMDDFDKEVKKLSKMSGDYLQAESNNLTLLHGLYDESAYSKKEIEILKRNYEDIRRENHEIITRQSQEFNTKLKNLKDFISTIPSEIPEMRKVIDEKIQISELNGQNAILRTSNNERQIMLIEKKIENLYQQIKSVELTMRES